MKKAAFLDRDGVINQKAPGLGYITRWEDFHLLPGVAEAISLLNAADFLVIVVSNQRGIAKGLVSTAVLDEIHANMRNALLSSGSRIEAVYYCPHDNFPPCKCRKPAPGMLLTAAREHDIDLPNSWMIGDSLSDVQAGQRAGCKTILLTQSMSLLDAANHVVAGL
jgi:D-glycero-D-manno-heptose 1,7-bisphosphate phosphatase